MTISSYELNKLITTSKIFARIKLTPSSKLVLRCIVDYWNSKTCCAYPKQSTIAECTGLTRVAVNNSIQELVSKNLIETKRSRYTLTYIFTDYFFEELRYKNPLHQMLKTFTSRSKNYLHVLNRTNKDKKIKEQGNNNFSTEETRKLLDSYKQVQAVSPLDDYNCAINWLNNLDETSLKLLPIRQMYFKVLEKWNISID